MKEFVDKLIGRLEEKFKYNSEQAEIYRDGSDKDAYFREKKDLYIDRANIYGEVIRIINQLVEEYINTSTKCKKNEAKNNKCYANTCDNNNIDNTCMFGNASERKCCVQGR